MRNVQDYNTGDSHYGGSSMNDTLIRALLIKSSRRGYARKAAKELRFNRAQSDPNYLYETQKNSTLVPLPLVSSKGRLTVQELGEKYNQLI